MRRVWEGVRCEGGRMRLREETCEGGGVMV